MSWLLNSDKATEQFGGRLVDVLEGSGIVFLKGDLGAGKTTLCRGVLRALGYTGAVKSPTFTLVEPYELPVHPVYHFDLYRLRLFMDSIYPISIMFFYKFCSTNICCNH